MLSVIGSTDVPQRGFGTHSLRKKQFKQDLSRLTAIFVNLVSSAAGHSLVEPIHMHSHPFKYNVVPNLGTNNPAQGTQRVYKAHPLNHVKELSSRASAGAPARFDKPEGMKA